MPQHTDLNVSPYFDDFDPKKNYHKVLFKPGYPVQARELTTLQSIFQNQIESFGKNIFKEGSVVIPGQTKYDASVFAVQVESEYNGVPISLYLNGLVGKRLKGSISGVSAEVVYVLSKSDSDRNKDTIYLRFYESGGADLKNKVFSNGETLTLLSAFKYNGISFNKGQGICNTIANDAMQKGSLFSVTDGVYFVRGFFVNVVAQTIILDQYSSKPNYKVGFNVIESVVTADEDQSLYDNAQGFSNYAAPGADRFKIELELSKKPLTDTDTQNFVEIFRVTDGKTQSYQKNPQYALIRDEMARRVYDQSGDFFVRPFSLFVRDCLNDRVLSNGLYYENQLTMSNNKPSEDKMIYEIGSGKAYVNGYDVETLSAKMIDVPKTRTTKTLKNQQVTFNAGLLAYVNNVYGSPTIGLGNGVVVSLMDSRVGTNPTVSTGSTIGIARVYDYIPEAGYFNDSSRILMRLYDIQTYTKIQLTTPITLQSPAYIEGVRSNASGFLVSSVSSSANLTLYETNGAFLVNEPIRINGIDNGRLIYSVTDYRIGDIKSLYSNTGVSNGFTADLVLNSKKLIATPGTNFQITARSSATSNGISTVTAGLGTDFINTIRAGDIITYSGLSTTGDPIYNKVVSISAGGNSFTIAPVATVLGVCDGALPSTNTTVSNINRLSTNIQNKNSSLLTPIKNENISSINIEDNELSQRRFYGSVPLSGDSLTVTISDPDIYFDAFSADRFFITYDTGKIEYLTFDKYSLDTSGKQLQFIGLTNTNGASYADVITTVKNLKPNSKIKKLNRASSIVIDGSINQASGIGATTLNDGLTYTNIYGLRIQDEQISLNVPDVINVLAIYESTSVAEPSLPKIVCTGFTGSQNSAKDFVVGEHINGESSGSVGLITKIIDASTIEFIYLNNTQFVENEVVSGTDSKTKGIVISKLLGDKNITQNFTLEHGYTDTYYDFSRIIRKEGVASPSRKIKVIFQNYTIDSTDTGEFMSVNSYPASTFKHDIPYVENDRRRLTDYIDIRPRVAPYTPSQYSPFEFQSRNFGAAGQYSTYTIAPGENIILGYSYYLPRIDRVYLTPSGNFEISRGVPADNPKVPEIKANCLDIATIHIPPYVFNTKSVVVDMAEHKRYTMKDISELENRIERVERFTTLTSLENKTENFKIKDAETGLDRFKCGFFVDNFSTTTYQETNNPLFRSCIDTVSSTLRPPHRSTKLDLQLGSEAISGIGSTYLPNLDHSHVTDLGSPGVRKTGDLITLNYTEKTYYEQLVATRSEYITPFLVRFWQGSIQLFPPADTWHDELSITVPITVTNTTQGVAPPVKNVTVTNNVTVGTPVNTKLPVGQTGTQPFDWIANARSVLNTIGKQKAWGGSTQGGLLQETWRGEVTKVTDNNIHLVFTNRFFNTTGESIIRKILPPDVADQYINKIKSGAKDLSTTVIDFAPPKQTTTTTQSTNVSTTFTPQPPQITETVTQSVSHYTQPIRFLRSRNIEFDAKSLRPVTRFYPFFQGIDVSKYIVPKLLEIKMISGKFQVGEKVVSDAHFLTNRVAFRLCTPNHKFGPFNNPTQKYNYLPYTQQTFPTTYSESSTFLNVDTLSMQLQSETQYYGSVAIGMRLIGQSSKAVAEITNIRLVSDSNGRLIGSLFVPDPSTVGNPKWINGENTFTVSDLPTLQPPVPAPNEIIANTVGSQSSASADFHSEAWSNVTETDIITTRNVVIIPPQKVVTTTITNTTTYGTGTNATTKFSASSFDPLAESFIVNEQNGIFLTSVDIFFETKDESVPVTLQIRPMDAGVPSNTIIPFSEVTLNPDLVGLSTNGSKSTRFTFPSPVYLSGSTQQSIRQAPVANAQPKEYSVVLLSASPNYRVFVSRLGEKDLLTGVTLNAQPSLGSLFKSQEGSTWTPSQLEDLKFRLNKASFVKEGLVRFFNPVLSYKNKKVAVTGSNHSLCLSKTIVVGLGSTGIDPNVGLGVSIMQDSATANLVGLAGSVTDLSVVNAGTGYTNGTFNNISLITETGYGKGATANIVVASNKVTSATVVNSGTGYEVGDSLKLPRIGNNIGFGGQLVVTSIGSTNTFVLGNVQGQFKVGISTLFYTDYLGITTYVGAGVSITSIFEDQFEDGLHMKITHPNHGMHSPSNLVQITDFRPNVEDNFAKTTANITSSEQTTIQVDSTAGFETFEGLPVSASNPGYVIIGHEVIKYTSYSSTTLTNLTRAIDGTVSHPYNSGVPVYKYEFNGVSLRRINKIHDLGEVSNPLVHPTTLDDYYIKVSMAATDFQGNQIGKDRRNGLYFTETSQSGCPGAEISSNFQFEAITPTIRKVLPPGTVIEPKIRTTSATSIGGNEISFVDKGFEDIKLDQINTFKDPRMVCSKVNEDRYMTANPGNRSFSMQFYMTTNSSDLSPVIDTAFTSVLLTTNRINDPIGIQTALSYSESTLIRSLNSDPHDAIYISKIIKLDVPANSLKVLLTAKRNTTNDIRVMYRLFRNDSAALSSSYQLFPGYSNYKTDGFGIRRVIDPSLNDGSEDFYSQPSGAMEFRDYEYTADNLPEFNAFSIKIVMAGTNQAQPPVFADLRAIATVRPQT
jgi:hypothetical protein